MQKNKLTVVLAIVVTAFLVIPSFSFAQSVDSSIQAQIQALYAEIVQLQAQLATQGGSAVFCYTFNSNMGIGATGTGVTNLQTALQKDGESVTVSGTYDETTASAVSAFQEKYRSDILTPSSLSAGTGYVGAATRAKLNSLFGCGTTTTTPVTSTTTTSNVAPVIASISPTSATVGSQVTITGTNFGASNIVFFNGYIVATSVSSNGTTMTFTVPSTLRPNCATAAGTACPQYLVTVTPGTYSVSVRTNNVTSNSVIFTVMSSSNQTQASTIPTQVQNLTASASGNNTVLSWSPISGIRTYIIYRGTTADFVPNYTSNGVAMGNVTTYTDQNLYAGTYYYKVVAREDSDNLGTTGPASAAASVTIGSSATIQTQYPSLAVSYTSINSGGSTSFQWSVPTGGVFTQPIFTIGPCFSGITMYDVTNGQTFYCGSVNRTVAWSGSDVVQFTNVDTNPVSLTAQLAFGTNQPLTYALTIGAGAPVSASSFTVAPTSLNFMATQGQSPASRTVSMTNISNIGWGASPSSSGWLTVNGNDPDQLGVVVNSSNLSAGTYTGSIKISGNFVNSPITIPVTLVVTAPAVTQPQSQAPAISIKTDATNPASGTLTAGSTGNTFLVFDVANNSSEDVKITSISGSVTGAAAIAHLALQSAAGSVYTTTVPNSNGSITFNLSTPLTVSHQNSVVLVLRADVCSLQNCQSIGGTRISFAVSSASAVGASSALAATQTGSATGNTFTVSTPTSAAPTQVQNLTASASGNSAVLSWSPISGISTYIIYRGTTSNFVPNYTSNGVAMGNITTYTDQNLSAGTYYYEVVARDNSGTTGPASVPASVTIGSSAKTYSPTYSLSAPNGYKVGKSWTATVTNAAPNVSVDICGTHGTVTGCTTNFSSTNSNGAMSNGGTFGGGDVGSWTEWARFPDGTTSNSITFTVVNTTTTSATM